MKKRLSRDTKVVIGAIAILIIMIFVFNTGITGNPIARWIRPVPITSVPSSEDKGVDLPEIAPSESKPVEPVGSNIALKIKGTVCTSAGDVYRAGYNYGCNNAIDGNPNTYWSISANGKYDNYPKNTWIKLDLAKETWINKIVLKSINIKAIGWIKKGTLTLYDSTGNKVETISDITVPYGRSVPTGISIPISPKKIKSARFDVIQTWGPNAGLSEFEIYVTSIPKCIDGTIHGQCSKNKPKYCENGNSIDNCQKCGCPQEYKCSKNNGCEYNGLSCIGPSEINPYKKETTIGYDYNNPFMGIKTFTDSCFNSRIKQGYTCRYTKDGFYAMSTSHYCITGCSDGICIDPEPQCTDTDITSEYPDGKNPFKIGTATGIKEVSQDKPVLGSINDVCSSDGTKLYEKYCSYSAIGSVFPEIKCPCENGICKCYDTDEGDKIYTKGKVSDGTNSFEDICISNTKLKEYRCEGSQINSREVECEVGCENGACVRSNLCKELIQGQNNLNEERMNFVFVGLNYENTVIFKKLLEMLIDYNGEYYGLYSLEPFQSNKKKINFWYVDEIGTVPKTSSSLDKRDAINNLLEYCNLKNKEYMALINYGYSPSAHEMGIPAGKGIIEDFDEYKSYNRKSLILFAHEMGHHFFEAGEDYVWGGSPAPPTNYKGPPNCFVGTKEDCESSININWYDLMGNGCGADNVLDCDETDPNYNAEIGCFEGCNNFAKGIFRSTRATLMYICNEQPGSKALGEISNCAFTYGLFNERRICKRLKALTGSVGGYCITKFGIS